MDTPGEIINRNNQAVILFDGVCNLCNGAVQFIIKRDKQNKFLFASLQSGYAQQQLKEKAIDFNQPESIVLLKNGNIFQRSNAALEIARDLSGIWPALYVFKIFPVFIRDGVYDFISRNRYKFFGRRDACMIPSAKMREKFIA